MPASRRAVLRWALAGVASVVAAAALAPAMGRARPERVRPGMAFYSDEIVVQDGVADLAEERNYEEVYRHYAYYEAWYDAQGRVVKCIAYRRGEVLWQEVYTYGPDGRPVQKQITDAQGRTRVESLR